MDEVTKDPRFAHIVNDAKFKRLPKKHVKVKVDKRFQSMFTDKKFQIKCKVDKRGRPLVVNATEDLKHYYNLSETEDESDNESEEKVDSTNKISDDNEKEDQTSEETSDDNNEKTNIEESKIQTKKGANDKVSGDDLSKADKKDSRTKRPDKKLLTAEIKKKLRDSKTDYARGEGKFLSDSSSDEEDSEVEDSDLEEQDWGLLDNDAETTEETTNRLAICHMDWDRIKAVDLMILFHSFLPPGGLIHNVTIFPSEFGSQRMKEEEEQGPIELKELTTEKEDEEMDRKKMAKLRKYQLNRLKYYYAIMVCDTKETANFLYKECDGLEYECSAVKLDLRFVPDDTTFDQEPKDICTAIPDLSTYKPRLFQTSALTRSKVELTWDENDPDREELVKSVRSGNVNEDQLKQYLAYSSEEENENEDEDEDEKILINEDSTKTETEESALDKYKSLLADIESKEKKKKNNQVNLEVTWNLELENKANDMVKKRMKDTENLKPFEQFIEKKKEKKKRKKEERMTKMGKIEKDSEEEGEEAFSDDDIPSDVDLNDPYFKEEFEGKKGKKKRNKSIGAEEETEEGERKKAELELLMIGTESEDRHFSLKKIEINEKRGEVKKGKKRKADEAENEKGDDFEIDVNDERFSALYNCHHFNIDPTDPQFRATKATRELIREKLKRRAVDEPVEKQMRTAEIGERARAEINLLVKNIKKNTAEMKRH